jgi:hypothetical protein
MEILDKDQIIIAIGKEGYDTPDRASKILNYLEQIENKEIELTDVPEDYLQIMRILTKKENETAISHIYRILTSDCQEAIKITSILEDFDVHVLLTIFNFCDII